MPAGRILVIRGGAIGDFILTLPALQALRDAFPRTKIEVLGYPQVASLAQLAGLADAARAIEAPALAGFFVRNGTLDKNWAAYFSRFEIILSYLYDPDGIFQGNVRRCRRRHSETIAGKGTATFIQGPHRPDESCGLHAAEALLEPLQQLTIFDADSSPHIRLPRAAPSLTSGPLWLAVHPGSGSVSKNWPLENWLQWIVQFQEESNWNLLVVGGEAERGSLQKMEHRLIPSRSRLELCTPLPRLAALLAECRGFIGQDSGISHLAAAVGLPGLVLWGKSEEAVWRPRSERVAIMRHENGLRHLPTEQVFAWFREHCKRWGSERPRSPSAG